MLRDSGNRKILGMDRRRMSDIHENACNREKIFHKWGEKTKSKIIVLYVRSHIRDIGDKEMEATYDFIHFKMQNDGYSEESIIRYIEHFKDLLEVNSERLATILSMFKTKEAADRVFYNYPRILTRKIPLNKFFTVIQELDNEFGFVEIDKATSSELRKEDKKTAPIDQMEATYKFIVDKFLNDKFSKEQAREFIDQNLDLLQVPTSKIMSELAILSLVSLEDKVFYENTDLITSKPPITRIYGAIKSSSSKVSVDTIRKHLEKPANKTVSYDGELTREKLSLIYYAYKRNFEKQVKEREEKRTL